MILLEYEVLTTHSILNMPWVRSTYKDCFIHISYFIIITDHLFELKIRTIISAK